MSASSRTSSNHLICISQVSINTIAGARYIDYFTDALMLLNASYSGDEGLIDRTINVYRWTIDGKDPNQVIADYYSGVSQNDDLEAEAYSRYWHGYLIFLKPLLVVFNYQQILMVNAILQVLLIITALLMMYKRECKELILPFLISIILIQPRTLMSCMQYSTCFYIFTISSILILLFKDKLKDMQFVLLLFVEIGCLTSYFDLLTYPIATFGIPATIYCYINMPEKAKESVKKLIVILMGWGIGYAGMWTMKWVVGFLLTGNVWVILLGIGSVLVRTSSKYWDTGEAISFGSGLYLNLREFLKNREMLLPVIYVMSCIILTYKRHKLFKIKPGMISLLIVSLLPLAWYFCTNNHSNIHALFTYKALVVSAFSGLCMVRLVVLNNQKDR